VKLRYFILGAAVLAVGGKIVVSEVQAIGIHKGYAPQQPIAFPHKVHAGDNKIACLYCHSAARTSRHAGIPAVSVCMNCHSMLEKQTREIEKLKEAVQREQPVAWVKVHNLPDFVYFNHSQHIQSGVACQNCHGAVEKMDRVEQATPLTMGFCLSCHREHANLPTGSLERVMKGLKETPTPTAGLDCGSCHY
jgi:uncharacterized paraquat-inducible protein A